MPLPNYESSCSQVSFNIPTIKDMLYDENLSLANELKQLKLEIAALREMLMPIPSFIVTGRQALDEFKKLRTRHESL